MTWSLFILNLSKSLPPSTPTNTEAASNAQAVNIFDAPYSIFPAKDVDTMANSDSGNSDFFDILFNSSNDSSNAILYPFKITEG